MSLALYSVITFVAVFFSGCGSNSGNTSTTPSPTPTEAPVSLHFDDNNKSFKILMFVDLHYGENFITGNLSDTFQQKLLEMEKPDLVVFNGDMSSDYSATNCQPQGNCTDWFIEVWKQYTKPVSDANIPYAITIGNHDAIGDLPDARFISRYDQEHGKMSFTRAAPPEVDAGSVYYVPLYASSTASRDRPTAVLWMIDTGARDCYGVPGYGCAGYDQVQWFMNKSSESSLDGVQGLMFGHIPFVEVMTYYSLYHGSQPHVEGVKGENVTCSSLNTGMMGAAIEKGVTGIFHGHDHKNDYHIDLSMSQGRHLTIGYGRKSGYGGYNGGVANDPGARVINLVLDPTDSTKFTWSSYIRTEKGEIVDQKNESSTPNDSQQLACGMF